MPAAAVNDQHRAEEDRLAKLEETMVRLQRGLARPPHPAVRTVYQPAGSILFFGQGVLNQPLFRSLPSLEDRCRPHQAVN